MLSSILNAVKSKAQLALAKVRSASDRARLSMEERDNAIRAAIAAGCSLREVAQEAGLGKTRVWQIAGEGDH